MTSTFFCANEPWSHHLKLQSIGNKINTSEWSHWDQDEKKKITTKSQLFSEEFNFDMRIHAMN